MQKKCFASWANDNRIIKTSSSGGIFTVIAEYIIDNGGVIYGVTQNPNSFCLRQERIIDKEKLEHAKKSKYYQSEPWHSFKEVRQDLLSGNWVLYSGTACQIAGIQSYLQTTNTNTDKFITVDILCHGVSNIHVYKRYLESQEQYYEKAIKKTEFRTKDLPWENGCGTSMTFFLMMEHALLKAIVKTHICLLSIIISF